VRFEFGGSEYEIDLSADNVGEFRKQLPMFIEHAAGGGARAAGSTAGQRPRP
jgi:hypothetical protein